MGLDYRNNMNCYVTLKLPETRTMELTIDNFISENGCCDYFYVFDGTDQSKYRLKTYNGHMGDISYQWSGNAATFHWETDDSVTIIHDCLCCLLKKSISGIVCFN